MGSWYVDKIIIDSKEKKRGINAYNYYVDTYELHVESLEYGDYLFMLNDGNQVIFEYKTCQDFINSMTNKSLFHELANQTIHYEHSYLIVCGDFNEMYEYLYFNVPYYRYKYKTIPLLKNRLSNQINGALARIYAMYIPIIFVDTEEEAFAKMLKISSKIADTKKYGGVVRPIPKKDLDENPTAFFLTGISGIGEKKSKNIINELNINCLEDLCERKPSDFLSVHSMSKKNVCDLWYRVHNEEIEL